MDLSKHLTCFNNFFICVPRELVQKINPLPSDEVLFQQFSTIGLCLNQIKSLFINPTTEPQVIEIVKKFENKKSSGSDGVSPRIFKLICHHLTSYLAYIFNLSFASGKFPDKLKHAVVVPVFKKGQINSMDCYRPIKYLEDNFENYRKINVLQSHRFL